MHGSRFRYYLIDNGDDADDNDDDNDDDDDYHHHCFINYSKIKLKKYSEIGWIENYKN